MHSLVCFCLCLLFLLLVVFVDVVVVAAVVLDFPAEPPSRVTNGKIFENKTDHRTKIRLKIKTSGQLIKKANKLTHTHTSYYTHTHAQ